MTKGTELLRSLLNGQEIIVAPGCFDAFSALVAQESGFPVLYMSGGLSSTSLCGTPDIGVRTLSELALQVRHICRSVDRPVITDGEAGYGGIANIFRLVQEMEDAGIAGIHLEDQDLPKRCGHMKGKRLVSAEEHSLRIQAAVDARRDSDFVIIARTDAISVTGFKDAIKRAQRYVDAGADMIFIEGFESREQMVEAIKEVKAHHMINIVEGGETRNIPVTELGEIGFKVAIFPYSAFGAALWAMRNVWAELRRAGTTGGFEAHMEPLSEWMKMTRTDFLLERLERICLSIMMTVAIGLGFDSLWSDSIFITSVLIGVITRKFVKEIFYFLGLNNLD